MGNGSHTSDFKGKRIFDTILIFKLTRNSFLTHLDLTVYGFSSMSVVFKSVRIEYVYIFSKSISDFNSIWLPVCKKVTGLP